MPGLFFLPNGICRLRYQKHPCLFWSHTVLFGTTMAILVPFASSLYRRRPALVAVHLTVQAGPQSPTGAPAAVAHAAVAHANEGSCYPARELQGETRAAGESCWARAAGQDGSRGESCDGSWGLLGETESCWGELLNKRELQPKLRCSTPKKVFFDKNNFLVYNILVNNEGRFSYDSL